MHKTKISYSDLVWNPVTGCSKISEGCRNCTAEKILNRLQARNLPEYKNGFNLTLQEESVFEPLHVRKNKTILVNNLSDTFHEDIPKEYIQWIFQVMSKATKHRFLVCTKRIERAMELQDELEWPTNIWLGVSVENADYVYRIEKLKQIRAHNKFIEFAPLIGPIESVNLSGIDRIIIAGERGKNRRHMFKSWVDSLISNAESQNVPYHLES